MHSFLLIGQSNAGGRGFPNEVEPINSDKIFVLRNGKWRKMYVPVNADRVTSGICLIESFADLYSKEHNIDVGIIPCADGGSSMEQWHEGDLLFDHACYMAELASRTSDIVGVLWHQGESDCSEEDYPLYRERLKTFIKALKTKLNLPFVPFILGGLGDFLKDCDKGDFTNYIHINTALENIADNDETIGFASAEGLTANPDNLHFSAKALREFGIRYYNEYKKIECKNNLIQKNKSFTPIIENDIELL